MIESKITYFELINYFNKKETEYNLVNRLEKIKGGMGSYYNNPESCPKCPKLKKREKRHEDVDIKDMHQKRHYLHYLMVCAKRKYYEIERNCDNGIACSSGNEEYKLDENVYKLNIDSIDEDLLAFMKKTTAPRFYKSINNRSNLKTTEMLLWVFEAIANDTDIGAKDIEDINQHIEKYEREKCVNRTELTNKLISIFKNINLQIK